MKVLIISDVLLRKDNGVGNSYINIFSGLKDVTIANICCQEGESDNNISQKCFQISESRLIQNFRNSKIPAGITEVEKQYKVTEKNKSSNLYGVIKRFRFQIFFWLRNAIWKFGRWKCEELREFIDKFEPDVIFAQLQDKMYLNNIVSYVAKYVEKPLILYAWDDVYSLRQYSLSPLFWIDRFLQRYSIRKLVKQSKVLYTISQEQKEEYKKSLHVRTELLYKGYSFENEPKSKKVNVPLKIIYTGNLYSGRYQTLLELCKVLDEYNQNMVKAQIEIYSGTELTKKAKKQLNIGKSSFFKGKVTEQEVQEIQKKADVLLHIEPMDLKGSLLCRLSFSTKLVDYFNKRKCIFAIGSERCSSIKYLQRNDAAIVSINLEQAKNKLFELLEKSEMIEEYAGKAWNCGKKNHEIERIQQNLMKIFLEVSK